MYNVHAGGGGGGGGGGGEIFPAKLHTCTCIYNVHVHSPPSKVSDYILYKCTCTMYMYMYMYIK